MKFRLDPNHPPAFHRFTYFAVILTLLSTPILYSQQAPRPASKPEHKTDVSIPMRDGVILRADILLPSTEGKFPALIYRTPYGKHFALKEYKTFDKAIARGYAVVVQDVRGRYASDGEFVAYQNEGRDGFDTIEWAAKQP